MNKAYPSRINWENYSSTATPLGATNLNKMDSALYTIDGRVCDMDVTKAKQSDLLECLKNVDYNTTSGIFTFTFQNGSVKTVDLNVEKIPVSFSMSATGVITMKTSDGTEYTADVGSLIKTYTFNDGNIVDFTVTTDTNGNKTVTADIKNGSITGAKLQPNYLADITAQATTAQNAATAASTSESKVKTSETNAKTSETNASNSAISALSSSGSAKTSETNAKTSETNASRSETNAKTSENKAKTSETNAKSSEDNAFSYKNQAEASKTAAATSELNASTSATTSSEKALVSEGYSSGTQNGVPVDSSSPYYQNNAKYYKDQAQSSAFAQSDWNESVTTKSAYILNKPFKTIGANLSVDPDGVLSADAQSITVDSELSDTSENPVQNKVIKSAIDSKADSSSIPTKTSDLTNDSDFVVDANYVHIDVDNALSDTSENPVQNKIIKAAIDAATPSDYGTVKSQVTTNKNDITSIKSDLSNLSNGSNVKVTFDSSLVGKSATLTKGTKVYTKTVGTDSTCLFKGIEEVGTFTLACDGNTMSVSLPCYSYYEFSLGVYGFQGWLDSANITTSFTSLDEVLADEKTLRILFTKHDSVDYLVEWEEADSTVASILNNDLVAKWINLRDYALDTLYASTTCKALMDTYDKYGYGELALIGQVPILSSNTSSIVADSEWATELAKYLAFDNNSTSFWCSQKTLATTNRNVYIGYTFNSAINVRSVKIVVDRANSVVIIQGKNSGEWENIPNTDGQTEISIGKDETINLKNSKSYLTYRVLFVSQSSTEITTDYGAGRVKTLQFLAYAPKGNVPIMTSNSAPYGECSASGTSGSNYIYYAFDNNDSTRWCGTSNSNSHITYKFTNPINVKSLSIKPYYYSNLSSAKAYKVQGSNDGSTFTDIYSGTFENRGDLQTVKFSNDNYYMYYRLLLVSSYHTTEYQSLYSLQFYGRSLSVSVPTMTSNTSPWGEVISSTVHSTNYAYKGFDGLTTDYFNSQVSGAYLGYKFVNPVCVKSFKYVAQGDGWSVLNGKIQGSNDGSTWEDVTPEIAITTSTTKANYFGIVNNNKSYSYYRLLAITKDTNASFTELQFYGLDYSEHSERHYIYDNGVELETLTTFASGGASATKESSYLSIIDNTSSGYSSVGTNGINLTPYTLERVKVGNLKDTSNSLMLCVGTSYNGGYGSTMVVLNTTEKPNNCYYGISSFNESKSCVIGTNTSGTGVDATITEWWLE